MKSATCLLAMSLTFLLGMGSGCIEVSKMLAPPPPPPPADNTEMNTGDNTNANNASDDNDAASDDSQSADVDTNGDSDAADDANTNGSDDADTSGLDDADTSGISDTDSNGSADANTNSLDDTEADANDGGLPPLPDGALLTTTASGLQFFDFRLGGGEIPTITSTVRVAYTGYLEDGTVFDSNENATFNLSSLIAGFGEGVSTMNVGGRRRLLIPPDLGYGSGGNAGAGIGGEDTIIFDVELLAIEDL